MNLKNKVAVVTGASDGLGFSIANKLSEKGAQVNLIARNKERLDQMATSIGGNCRSFAVDVADYNRLEEIATEIGEVHLIINNAGVWIEGPLTENSVIDIKRAIDTNLMGVIFTTKAFLPHASTSTEAHIFNIASTSGLTGRESQAVYTATKFGVRGFTESLEADLAGSNIKVSGFFPGGMNTKLFEKAGQAKDNSTWMDPNKVAEVVIFMLERDQSMVMNFAVLNKRV